MSKRYKLAQLSLVAAVAVSVGAFLISTDIEDNTETVPAVSALLLQESPTIESVNSVRSAVEQHLLAGAFVDSNFNQMNMIEVLSQTKELITYWETSKINSGSNAATDENIDFDRHPKIYSNYVELVDWLQWADYNTISES